MSINAKELKEQINIREALEYYGLRFNRHGYTNCPFHDDRYPSFIVGKHTFTCFGCGESGDIIDFVRKMYGLSFVDAMTKINNDFSLNLNKNYKKYRTNQKQKNEKLEIELEKQIKLKRLKILVGGYEEILDILQEQCKTKEITNKIKDKKDKASGLYVSMRLGEHPITKKELLKVGTCLNIDLSNKEKNEKIKKIILNYIKNQEEITKEIKENTDKYIEILMK